MFNPFIDAYFQNYKMVLDAAAVLNYRLPMLQSMVSDPAILWNPIKWFEVNSMVSEKILAFSHANILLAMNLVQLPFGKVPSAEKLLQLQRETLQPVRTTLSRNARRFKNKKT